MRDHAHVHTRNTRAASVQCSLQVQQRLEQELTQARQKLRRLQRDPWCRVLAARRRGHINYVCVCGLGRVFLRGRCAYALLLMRAVCLVAAASFCIFFEAQCVLLGTHGKRVRAKETVQKPERGRIQLAAVFLTVESAGHSVVINVQAWQDVFPSVIPALSS